MPGAPLFRHQLDDAAVLEHDVVRGDFARRRAQTLTAACGVAHAGVVQHDHVGRAPPLRSPWLGEGTTSATTQELGAIGHEHDHTRHTRSQSR